MCKTMSLAESDPLVSDNQSSSWCFPEDCRRRDDGSLSNVVRNFGFGSNLDVRKMESRGIHALRVRRAILKGWRLAFNMAGFPPIEPSFANVVYTGKEEDEVHGLLYDLTLQDFETLWKGEGAGDWYNSTIVHLELYEGEPVIKEEGESSQSVAAVVFTSLEKRLTSNGECVDPSKRYMTMLVDGSQCAKLKPEYCEYLHNLPVAKPPPLPIQVMWEWRVSLHQFACRQKGVLGFLLHDPVAAYGRMLYVVGPMVYATRSQYLVFGLALMPAVVCWSALWPLEKLGY